MQKFGLVFLLIIPVFSYADTVRLINAIVHSQDGIMGHSLGYSGINNNKYITTLNYTSFSEGQWRSSAFSVGVNYGFQSINTGSLYFGIGVARQRMSGGFGPVGPNDLSISIKASDQSGYARLGYTKLSGEGIDYDYNLVSIDGETSFGALFRGAINTNGLGWLFGVSSNSEDRVVSGGINLIF